MLLRATFAPFRIHNSRFAIVWKLLHLNTLMYLFAVRRRFFQSFTVTEQPMLGVQKGTFAGAAGPQPLRLLGVRSPFALHALLQTAK